MTPQSVALVVLLVILDQLTKFLVSINLQPNESLPVAEGIFHITRVHNTGIAFGFFKGMISMFIFLSVAMILFIILGAKKFPQGCSCLRLGLLLILGGTIGNLIDRVRLGYVIDFIDLRVWPVFNVADSAITVGGLLLIFHIIRKRNASYTV